MELLFLAFYYSSDLTFPLNLVKPTFPILFLITMSIWELSLGRNGPQLAIRPASCALASSCVIGGWWQQLAARKGICGFSSELAMGQVHRGPRCPRAHPRTLCRRETRKPLSKLKFLGSERLEASQVGGAGPLEVPPHLG